MFGLVPALSTESQLRRIVEAGQRSLHPCRGRAGLTLLLSLRFMSLVFEEARNIALGLAARNIDWKAQVLSPMHLDAS